MAELTKILQMTDEIEQRQALRAYEADKLACEADALGVRCSHCSHYKKPSCFNPNKAKNEGWKWN